MSYKLSSSPKEIIQQSYISNPRNTGLWQEIKILSLPSTMHLLLPLGSNKKNPHFSSWSNKDLYSVFRWWIIPQFHQGSQKLLHSTSILNVFKYIVARNKDTKPALSKNPLETGCFSNYYLNNALWTKWLLLLCTCSSRGFELRPEIHPPGCHQHSAEPSPGHNAALSSSAAGHISPWLLSSFSPKAMAVTTHGTVSLLNWSNLLDTSTKPVTLSH